MCYIAFVYAVLRFVDLGFVLLFVQVLVWRSDMLCFIISVPVLHTA